MVESEFRIWVSRTLHVKPKVPVLMSVLHTIHRIWKCTNDVYNYLIQHFYMNRTLQLSPWCISVFFKFSYFCSDIFLQSFCVCVHSYIYFPPLQVLYIQTPVEDLDKWSNKSVPLTWSAELTGLDSHAMYAIRVAARTRQDLGRLSELITVRVAPTGMDEIVLFWLFIFLSRNRKF